MNADKEKYILKEILSHYPLWKGEGPPAVQLDIELTERCNNACIHCCINQAAGDSPETHTPAMRELDTNAWKDILRQAVELGVMTVRFTGGEPLLRDDFSEIYVFARRLGLKVLLFTNATLITPQIAALLADIPPLEKIEISVYGMRKESYEAVTGVDGSYAAFCRGVQCLLDRKIPFAVKGALLPPNRNERAEFVDWTTTNPGIGRQKPAKTGTLPKLAHPWRADAPPVYSMFFDLRWRRDSAAKNNRIRGLRVSPEEGLEILTQDPDNYRKEMSEFFEKFLSPPGDRLFTCGIGPGSVDAYGVFQPCLSLRHPDLTFDLKKGPLKEAVASGFPRLKEMRATGQAYLERCARCFLRGFCEQCPAKSWAEHGALDTPVEYFCHVAHAQARFLGLVMKEERAWEVQNSEERIQSLKRRAKAT